MFDYIRQSLDQIQDGLWFGLGLLTVYFGAVITGALIRSLGGAGSMGLTFLGRYIAGWFDYVRGNDRTTINVTLNMVIYNHLKFDTLIADRRLWFVWPNAYRVHLIRKAAKRTTKDNPVVHFPKEQPRRGITRRITETVASVKISENGQEQRVPMIRDDDYRATYAPLIALIAEKCTGDDSIDLSIGRPMEEHRFVIALTFEQLDRRRARHLRAMVMYEPMLLDLPDHLPRVDYEEHKTRYRTLLAISRQYREHPQYFGVVKVWRPKFSAAAASEPMLRVAEGAAR
jgi:hypothetical protein